MITSVVGCADPPVSRAAAETLERETHLDDLPSHVASRDDAVVRVIAHGNMCSGTVVGEALVLTAGHCVYEQAPGYVYVELGKGALPWGRVGARNVEVCSGWRGGYDHDIGFVVLDRRLPDDVPRLRVREERGDDVGEIGTTFVARGFGTGMEQFVVPDLGNVRSSHEVERMGSLQWSTADTFGLSMRSAAPDSGGPVQPEGSDEVFGITTQAAESSDLGTQQTITVVSRISACRATLWRARAVASTIHG